MIHTPFPRLVELIRWGSDACNLNASRKKLHDEARKTHVDPLVIQELLSEAITTPLSSLLGASHGRAAEEALQAALEGYRQLVVEVDASGLCRSDLTDSLARNFLAPQFSSLSFRLCGSLGHQLVTILGVRQDSRTPIQVAFELIALQEPNWKSFIAGVDAESKAKLKTWCDGSHRPSYQSILLINTWPNADTIADWQAVKAAMVLANICSYLEANMTGLLADTPVFTSSRGFTSAIARTVRRRRKRLSNIAAIFNDCNSLLGVLSPSASKGSDDKDQLDAELSAVEAQITNCGLQGSFYQHLWLRARWLAASGEFEKACCLYKDTLDIALCRAGENLLPILDEAVAVAAVQDRPDKVFLKKLKFALYTFGEERHLKTRSSEVSEADIQMWRNGFRSTFPAYGMFDGSGCEHEPEERSPLLQAREELAPNLKRPDTKVYADVARKKRIHQLTWFCLKEDFQAVNDLIDAGARVDVISPVGETPLLMALEALNVMEVPYRSLDRRLYDLVVRQPNAGKHINLPTSKKRMLPIISATQTGQLDIVRAVLELGADPNLRGLSDEQTALNVCVKLVGYLRNPESFKKAQLEHQITPYVFDSAMRETGGLGGATMAQQKAFSSERRHGGGFRRFLNMALDIQIERMTEHMNLEEMIHIAKLLIDTGADVNAVMRTPLDGYTPLMLAAELDELELFEYMLINDGDLSKTYICPNQGRPVDCFEIAKYFESTQVQLLLDRIKPNLFNNQSHSS